MRRICGGDGFGVLRAKRLAFFLNLNMKDPESIAGKIMIEYTVTVIIRLLPKSTCKFLHPDIGKKNKIPGYNLCIP